MQFIFNFACSFCVRFGRKCIILTEMLRIFRVVRSRGIFYNNKNENLFGLNKSACIKVY